MLDLRASSMPARRGLSVAAALIDLTRRDNDMAGAVP